MSDTPTRPDDPAPNKVDPAMLRRLARVVRSRITIGGRLAFVKLRIAPAGSSR